MKPKKFYPRSLKYSSKTEYGKQKRPLEFNSNQGLRMFLSMEGTRQFKIIMVKILRACVRTGSCYNFIEVNTDGAAFKSHACNSNYVNTTPLAYLMMIF